MLNFTTTNIVNTDGTFGVIDDKGHFYTAADLGAQDALTLVGSATAIKKFRLSYGPEFNATDTAGGITKIYVNKASKAEYAKAEVSLSGLNAADVYRIQLYIRISGTAESTYANDWVFKGKPLSLGEFKGNTTAQNVVSLIKRHQLAMYGEDLVKVTAKNATTVVIEAKSQYQRFINQDTNLGVELQVYTPNADNFQSVYGSGEFVPVDGKVTVICEGKEAAGDFAHIVKNLRLPTDANLRWYGIANGDVMNDEANDDKPNPGVYYTQITVEYERERGLGNADVLGGLARSRTQHVFFVADSEPANGEETSEAETPASGVAANFLKMLKKAAPSVTPVYVEVPTSVA